MTLRGNMTEADAKMALPTIHLNGTSAKGLLDQQCDAAHALRDALKALGEAAPHGRDYYVQGPDAYAKAAKEHESRLARVRAVLDEIEAIAMHVSPFVK